MKLYRILSALAAGATAATEVMASSSSSTGSAHSEASSPSYVGVYILAAGVATMGLFGCIKAISQRRQRQIQAELERDEELSMKQIKDEARNLIENGKNISALDFSPTSPSSPSSTLSRSCSRTSING